MNTLETDIEVSADGSLKLLSPLPEWLKPGRVHVVLSVQNGTSPKPKRSPPPPRRCWQSVRLLLRPSGRWVD
jgi:hypothetical protein